MIDFPLEDLKVWVRYIRQDCWGRPGWANALMVEEALQLCDAIEAVIGPVEPRYPRDTDGRPIDPSE